MAYVVIAIIMVAALVTDATFLTHLVVAGVKPDLSLLLVTSFGLLYGPRAGFLSGLVGGLLQDLLYGRVVGLFALTKAVTGYLAGLATGRVYRENPLVVAGAFVAAAFVHDGLFYLVFWNSGHQVFTAGVAGLLGVSMVYHGLTGPFVHHWVYSWNIFERTRRFFDRNLQRRRHAGVQGL